MKATQGTTYRMLGSRLNDVALELENLRKIAASGIKLSNPSDDPAAIRPLLNTRKQISNVERYLDTMGQAQDTMQSTDSYLAEVEGIMQRAQEIIVTAANDTYSEEDRAVMADEIVQLQHQLLDAANGNIDGKYLFAGYREDSKPFVENPAYDPALYDPTDHTTWPVLYNGDENATSLEISPNERLQVTLTGNDLFLGTTSWDPAGTNSIEAGRYDLFAELKQAEEAIRNGDQAAMQTSLDDLQGAAQQNRRLRSQLGNRTDRVADAIIAQESVAVDLQEVLSRYQDADAIESFNAVVQQETAFQAALSVTGQVSRLSILDYI
ncbi:MAG: flagellar hook-associated protein 3 [Deltaproteobacteria bacterium]|nr:MAG: flagellar hook-associated protein 3 [Deltaproteobacteria bacterium]